MDTKLFQAILAMDAYNRGYGEGLKLEEGSAVVGTQIGMATIIQQSDIQPGTQGVSDSFYAIAYSYNSEVIVSYRGTDSFVTDYVNGYGIALGNYGAAQGVLALEFYNSVVGAAAAQNISDISFTGHSLGGGLAGFVASTTGHAAQLFNSMSFLNASENLVGTENVDLSGIQLTYMENEFLENNTGIRFFASSNIEDLPVEQQQKIDLGTGTSELSSADLHSMSTLVIRMFADAGEVTQTSWNQSAQYFWPVMYDDAFAQQIGLDNGQLSGADRAADNFSGILRTMIAYSAINEGAEVFGDTAIRALYDDANDYGLALQHHNASTLTAYAEGISKAFVQFAADLAFFKVSLPNVDQPLYAPQGMLSFVEGDENHTLVLDFDRALWTFNGHEVTDIAARSNLFLNVVPLAAHGAMEQVWGSAEPELVERAVFSRFENSTTTLDDTGVADKVTLFIGNTGDDMVKIGAGNNLVLAGAGTDTADYSGASRSIVATLDDAGAGFTVSKGADGTDALLSVENIVGTGFKDVFNVTTAAAVELRGGAGADTFAFSGAAAGGADVVLDFNADEGDALKFASASSITVSRAEGSDDLHVAGYSLTVQGFFNGIDYNDTNPHALRVILADGAHDLLLKGDGTLWTPGQDETPAPQYSFTMPVIPVFTGAYGAGYITSGPSGAGFVGNGGQVNMNDLSEYNLPPRTHRLWGNGNYVTGGSIHDYTGNNNTMIAANDGGISSIEGDGNYIRIGSGGLHGLQGNQNYVAGDVWGTTVSLDGDGNYVTVRSGSGTGNIFDIDGTGNHVMGGAGQDIFRGSYFNSYISTGGGGDILQLGADHSIIIGSGDVDVSGTYSFSYLSFTGGNAVVDIGESGSGGNYIYLGGAFNQIRLSVQDTLVLGSGRNIITIGTDDTIVNFKSGIDQLHCNGGGGHLSNLQIARAGDDLHVDDPVVIKNFFSENSADIYGVYHIGIDLSGVGLLEVGIDEAGLVVNPLAQTDGIDTAAHGEVSGNVLSDNGSGADSDPLGLAISVQGGVFATAQGGVFLLSADGSFSYQAAEGYVGGDSVSYTLVDAAGLTAVGTVNFSNVDNSGILPNHPPLVSGEAYNVDGQTVLAGNVLANDSDPDGDALSAIAQSVTTANGGAVVLNADGSFTYQAAAGFLGHDGFDYAVADGNGGAATGSADVNVVNVAASFTAGSGNGSVVNVAAGGVANAIALHDVAPEDVVMWTDENGNLGIRYDADDRILVNGSVDGEGHVLVGSHIQQIVFDNGTSLDLTQGLNLLMPYAGYSMVGTTYNDTLATSADNQRLYGGLGDDVYGFTAGSGNGSVIIEAAGAGNNAIALHGVSTTAVTMWTNVEGALYVQYDANDTIRVAGGVDAEGHVLSGQYVGQIHFDGGTAWDISHGLTLTTPGSGQTLVGTTYDDLIAATGSNETLYGGEGNDTYAFTAGSGDGSVIIEAAGAGLNTVALHGVAASDTALWTDVQGSLYVRYDAGNAIKVSGGVDDEGHVLAGQYITHMTFDDGTSWDLTQGLNLTAAGTGQAIVGTTYNDTLTATGTNDTLYGGEGDDVFFCNGGGNLLSGSAGADAFVFHAANAFNGVETIADFTAGSGNDALDISDVLSGCYTAGTSTLSDFVSITDNGSHSTLSVDRDGSGTLYNAQAIVQLNGLAGASVEDLMSGGNLLVS